MGLKEKTANSIKWNTMATIVTMVIGLIQVAILTHLLDKSDFGLIALASIVISFTDIFAELGVTAALIHKQTITENEYSSVYWLNIGVSIIIFVFTIAVAPIIALFYSEPSLTTIIRVLALRILFSAFGKLFQTIKTKNLEFDFISKTRILTAVVGLVVSTTLAYSGSGVMSLVYGQLAQIFINQCIYVIAGIRNMRVKLHFSFSEVRDVLKIGGYQLGTQVVDFIAARLDVLLIGRFFSMEQLGIYNIAKELIVKPFTIINGIISNVFSSAFAIIQHDLNLVSSNFSKLVKSVSIITVPVYSLIFIFADLIVAILYAPTFEEVAVYLRIMSLMGICSSLTSQGAPVMIAMGRTDLGLQWTVTRIIIATITLFATANISLYAVAYGQTIMSVISLWFYYFIVLRPIFAGMSFRKYLSMFLGIVVGILIISVPFSIVNILFEISLFFQLIMGGVAVFTFFVYFQYFHNNEMKEIIKIVFPKKIFKYVRFFDYH